MPQHLRPIRSPGCAQRGGTLLGLIVGLVLGLAIALVAALYITKAPLPFMNRFQERPTGAASGAANWNPNQGLVSGGAPAPVAGSSMPVQVSSAPLSPKAIESLGQPPTGVVQPGQATAAAGATGAFSPATPAPANTAAPAGSSNLLYILQIGAYSTKADAESQRAKVAFTGLEAHIDERQVGGRTLYRVRVGPYPAAEQADKAQKLLNDNGIESAVVKVSK
ncbi:MAG: SPOR domain-containing protein [Betaproteobacteria bacterium]|nr:SPOR domain-containing protein [Betaproteobacteria bacterium]MDE2122964.1 SPOR domain-containing protein [Betaproteobacteria bacterium]MDE2185207.1 SPOR domain-containing protein [Betaproteobacteria bacterium]MDE2325829.1 SPOR domain-containing protein [Betaproteobacteria bacterium]